MRIPKVDEVYNGFCCAGFDYLICLIFPDENPGYTSIWGRCQNPDCPKYGEDIGPDDPYRGVGNCDLDDFEDTLTDKKVKLTLGWCSDCGEKADLFKEVGNRVLCEVCWSEQ